MLQMRERCANVRFNPTPRNRAYVLDRYGGVIAGGLCCLARQSLQGMEMRSMSVARPPPDAKRPKGSAAARPQALGDTQAIA